jgi:NADH-ubiquinone oxidoreductase chain 6
MNSLLLDFLTFFSVLSAILVITARSPVIAVIFLIAVFINLAGYLILLGINFIGLAYIMLYIGAIAILFLFVIMMLNIRLVELSEVGSEYSKNIPLAIIIASTLSYLILSNTVTTKFDQIYLITALFDKVNFWLAGISSSGNHIFESFSSTYSNIFVNYNEAQVLGSMLYSSHGLYLVLVSFILLLAMIGPIIITLEKKSSNTPLSEKYLFIK